MESFLFLEALTTSCSELSTAAVAPPFPFRNAALPAALAKAAPRGSCRGQRVSAVSPGSESSATASRIMSLSAKLGAQRRPQGLAGADTGGLLLLVPEPKRFGRAKDPPCMELNECQSGQTCVLRDVGGIFQLSLRCQLLAAT